MDVAKHRKYSGDISAGHSSRNLQIEESANAQFLPPISRHSSRSNHPPVFGSNPFQNQRVGHGCGSVDSASEVDEIEDPLNQVEDGATLSLSICKRCQDYLLHAFDHCLSKHGEPIPLMSTHNIDEVSDGKFMSNPPLFDIVRDPTLSNKKIAFGDPKERLDRDRWIHQQAKLKEAKFDISTPRIKGLGVKSGKSFSGALYKRMLDAKDKEIYALRTQIFEISRREESDADNVKKLRKALNQSVNYYTFAEEWQQTESTRLQHDVRQLKSETSSLMAFLINSEVDKQNLVAEMKDMKASIALREIDAALAIRKAEEMKEKLQDSFKEFIAMDETMVLLRKEASKGSEAAESRNLMLQKNLNKLTVDFESSAQDLKISSNKRREYEYELEQMVKDLNAKGEALKKATAYGAAMKESFGTTTADLKSLQEINDHLILAKAKVEAEARLDNSKNEQQKQELRKIVGKNTIDLETLTVQHKDLTVSNLVQKAEIEQADKNIIALTSERDDLITVLSRSKATSKADISIRNTKIDELSTRIARDEIQLKTVTENKESLMFQITDLQNSLEIGTENGLKLAAELESIKKSTDEKINSLNDQVDKFSSIKLNLSNGKKELTEKVKTLRQNCIEKQEELDKCNFEWDEKYLNVSTELDAKLISLTAITQDCERSNQKIANMNAVYQNLVKENITLKVVNEISINKQDKTEKELCEVKEKVASLVEYKSGLQIEIAYLKIAQEKLSDLYAVVTTENEGGIVAHAKFKMIADECINERDAEIQEQIKNLALQQKIILELKSKIKSLESSLVDSNLTIMETINTLTKESELKEIAEGHLHVQRLNLQTEKRIRADLERVHVRLKYVGNARETNHLSDWRTRDRKLQEVSVGLSNEARRLNDLVNLLPDEKFKGSVGNEDI